MQTPQKTQSLRPFKQRKSLATRQEEIAGIWAKLPNKIPVEHYPRERFLPPLDKTEFLVPQELTATQVLSILRGCLVLWASEGFSLLVNNKSLVSMNVIMAEVHGDYQDEDGFVDMTCAPQEKFGCLGSGKTSAERVKNLASHVRRDGPAPVWVGGSGHRRTSQAGPVSQSPLWGSWLLWVSLWVPGWHHPQKEQGEGMRSKEPRQQLACP
ncbi:microtubule-associated proteins 1A/1B light chain 3C [Suricata suricatta]|uniref:microtubule-associated proteins 1A/1B light chain 3C n=1 Tax=Suricata suricatta TaxID=37032 RepID=UPI001155484B|nr:microtubule-associated proteins 1A/1B light chain 3C [Suricata suricatta]